MKTLYPVQKIAALLVAIVISGAASAQKGDYAINSNNSKATVSYAAQTDVIAGPVVRIMARSERKVVLSWAPFKEGVSHYVLERGGDGKHFEEAGLFFTGEWGNEPAYVYTDKLRNSYTGRLFYRLRVVGQDGDEVYTSVSIAEGRQ